MIDTIVQKFTQTCYTVDWVTIQESVYSRKNRIVSAD